MSNTDQFINASRNSLFNQLKEMVREYGADAFDPIYVTTGFCYACANNRIDVAKWFIQTWPNIDLDVDKAFRWACTKGHLDVVKWLITQYPNIDHRSIGDAPFRGACRNGYIKMACWLLRIFPDIDPRAEDDYAFRLACSSGHLHIAKWLYRMNPNVDYTEALYWALANGRYDVSKWLKETF